MKLSEKLQSEIESYNEEYPNVSIFIDEAGNIFGVTKNNEYIWLQKDKSFENYLDENHHLSDNSKPDGVMNRGVFWMNEDLWTPFHISDFEDAISTITI